MRTSKPEPSSETDPFQDPEWQSAIKSVSQSHSSWRFGRKDTSTPRRAVPQAATSASQLWGNPDSPHSLNSRKPTGAASSPQASFGASAVVQSSVPLPNSEHPGRSPSQTPDGSQPRASRILSRYWPPQRGSPVTRKAVLTQPSARRSSLQKTPGLADRHTQGARASLAHIMMRRPGGMPAGFPGSPDPDSTAIELPGSAASPLHRPSRAFPAHALSDAAAADSPLHRSSRASLVRAMVRSARRDVREAAASRAGGGWGVKGAVQAHPLDDCPKQRAPHLSPSGNMERAADPVGASHDSRPWSWSWAWTPPPALGSPDADSPADRLRLAQKFQASSHAICAAPSALRQSMQLGSGLTFLRRSADLPATLGAGGKSAGHFGAARARARAPAVGEAGKQLSADAGVPTDARKRIAPSPSELPAQLMESQFQINGAAASVGEKSGAPEVFEFETSQQATALTARSDSDSVTSAPSGQNLRAKAVHEAISQPGRIAASPVPPQDREAASSDAGSVHQASQQLSGGPELLMDDSPPELGRSKRGQGAGVKGSCSPAAIHRRASDTPSFRDGFGPGPAPSDGLWGLLETPTTRSRASSEAFRAEDLSRAATLSGERSATSAAGASGASPTRQVVHRTTRHASSRCGSGAGSEDVTDLGNDIIIDDNVIAGGVGQASAPEEAPRAIAAGKHSEVGRQPPATEVDPVQLLWSSCKKAASMQRAVSTPQAAGRRAGDGRPVPRSLLESMHDAANSSGDEDRRMLQRYPDTNAMEWDSCEEALDSAQESSAAVPEDIRLLDQIVEQVQAEHGEVLSQLAESDRERASLRSYIVSLESQLGSTASAQLPPSPSQPPGDRIPSSNSPASSTASCGKATKSHKRGSSRARAGDRENEDGSIEGQQSHSPRAGSQSQTALRSRQGNSDASGNVGGVCGEDSCGSEPLGSNFDAKEAPVSKEDWARQRLWWRARVRAAESEARRLQSQLEAATASNDPQGRSAAVPSHAGTETALPDPLVRQTEELTGSAGDSSALTQQLLAKDWLLSQLQEQLQESEEHNARLLAQEHARFQRTEREFVCAMREAEQQLAESHLVEEHMALQLQDMHEELVALREGYRQSQHKLQAVTATLADGRPGLGEEMQSWADI